MFFTKCHVIFPESRTATEEILLGRDTVEVPVQLYSNPDVFSNLFSLETWTEDLSQELKEHLMVGNTCRGLHPLF